MKNILPLPQNFLRGGISCFAFLFACLTVPVMQSQTYTVLHSFTFGDGASPGNGLAGDSQGNLYGVAGAGGDAQCQNGQGCGTVFKIDPSGAFTILHTFAPEPDGSSPSGAPYRDGAGNLYGVTYYGGNGYGTIYKVDPQGNETVLHNFGGSEGANPVGALVPDGKGHLYGIAGSGGARGYGTIFRMSKNGNVAVVHNFAFSDGSGPSGSLVMDRLGNLYGTTTFGGASDRGTVFKIDPSGTESVLYSFTGKADGSEPEQGVILDSAGNLYGTMAAGGISCGGLGCSVIFKLTPDGIESTVFSFSGYPNDGADANGPLLTDPAGNLYGTTFGGGTQASSGGTIFKIDPAGKETILYQFSKANGMLPLWGLIRDRTGNVYGTTTQGGASRMGTVFRLTVH
jgi:uncharacterized repeat protein (TIGR03803 family)